MSPPIMTIRLFIIFITFIIGCITAKTQKEYRHSESAEILAAVHGIDVNNGGFAELHNQIAKNNTAIVKLLLNIITIDVNRPNNEGYNSLCHAIQTNNTHMVKMVLAVDGIDVNAISKNEHGVTALHLAIFLLNNTDMINMLLAFKYIDVNVFAIYGGTPLHASVQVNNPDIVKLLLNVKGVDVNAVSKDDYGITALQFAIFVAKNAEIVKMLLAIESIDVNIASKNGGTALHASMQINDTAIASMLLAVNGIDVNAKTKDERHTSLHFAIGHANNIDMVKLLLGAADIDVNYISRIGGTVLHAAIQANNPSIVKLLLAVNGIDVNVANEHDGITALHSSIGMHNLNTVTLLLAVPSIDVNLATKVDGITALHGSISENSIPMLKLLLASAMINVNGVTKKDGNTALHQTIATHGNIDTIHMLLNVEGIDVYIKNNEGFTPLCLAIKKNNAIAMQLLIDFDSRIVNIPCTADVVSPLHYAVIFTENNPGNTELVTLLLTVKGIDVNGVTQGNISRLYNAKHLRRSEEVKRALTNTPDDSYLHPQGTTALHIATLFNNTKLVHVLLLTDTIDISIPDRDGINPAMIAALLDFSEITSVFVLYMQSIRRNDSTGETTYGNYPRTEL